LIVVASNASAGSSISYFSTTSANDPWFGAPYAYSTSEAIDHICNSIKAKVTIYDADGSVIGSDSKTGLNTDYVRSPDVENTTLYQTGDVAKGYHYYDCSNVGHSPAEQTSQDSTWD
jgi:hypothetical protein